MMTGPLGIVMWLMMGLIIAGLAGTAITWARRRLRRQAAQQPQPRRPEDNWNSSPTGVPFGLRGGLAGRARFRAGAGPDHQPVAESRPIHREKVFARTRAAVAVSLLHALQRQQQDENRQKGTT